MAVWHWTENGEWSDPVNKSGYFTGSPELKELAVSDQQVHGRERRVASAMGCDGFAEREAVERRSHRVIQPLCDELSR
jgi:hypothetical protein